MHWILVRTMGNPAWVRKCTQIAIVAAERARDSDFLSSLQPVYGGFAIAHYAEFELAVKLGGTLERLSGPIDFGLLRAWRDANARIRTASVHGELLIGNGRRERVFEDGTAGFLKAMSTWERQMRQWQEGGEVGPRPRQPEQLERLREFEAAGVPVVEFPPGAAANNRFGLTLIRPVVISLKLLWEDERLQIEWLED